MSKVVLLLSVMMLSTLAFVLFHMSYVIDQQNRQLNVLNAEIRKSVENISILESEWSYLSRPERLSALADKYLKMEPPQAVQIASLVDLSENLDMDAVTFAKIQASYGE